MIAFFFSSNVVLFKIRSHIGEDVLVVQVRTITLSGDVMNVYGMGLELLGLTGVG